MSKSSPLSREGLSPSLSLSLVDQNPPIMDTSKLSPKTGKPYRKQSPLQSLSTELNWDLAKLKQASSTLQALARKYNLVIPKILFKNVHAADLVLGVEKELKERVNESRTVRVKKLKEPAPVDNAPRLE